MKMVNEEQVASLKRIVKGFYDIQDIRLRTGLRVVTNWKIKLGQKPGTKEDRLEEKAKDLIKRLRGSYKKITDGVVNLAKIKADEFQGDSLVSQYTELCLLNQYFDLEAAEKKHYNNIANYIETIPLYTEFLSKINGIGPAMGGIIISHLDIRKAKYPSSLWQYVGVGVGADGKGMSKQKQHLVTREYIDKNGKKQTRQGTVFNPFVKTKLVGVLGDLFVKQKAESCPYRKYYDEYKNRMENHAVYGIQNDGKKVPIKAGESLGEDDLDEGAGEGGKKQKYRYITSKARRHRMAIRYAVKRFLVDLYVFWRAAEGLPVSSEYAEGKLKIDHKKVKETGELPPEIAQSNEDRIKEQLLDLDLDSDEDAA